jgi:hypothetical protein
MRIPVADGLTVEVCRDPVRFESPVSYRDPQAEADSALPPEAAEDEGLEAAQFGEMEDEDDGECEDESDNGSEEAKN